MKHKIAEASNLPPLAWAQAPLLAGEINAHSMSHPHTDPTVGYSLALCPPTLLVGLKTPPFDRLAMNCTKDLTQVISLYVDLWSTCPFSVRIFVVMAGSMSILGPR